MWEYTVDQVRDVAVKLANRAMMSEVDYDCCMAASSILSQVVLANVLGMPMFATYTVEQAKEILRDLEHMTNQDSTTIHAARMIKMVIDYTKTACTVEKQRHDLDPNARRN